MSIRQRNAHFTDWAAVCRALNVNTESEARTALESSDNTFYYYVCYIKSTKEIYTHGQIYSCSGNDDLLDLINELTTEVVENEEVTARALTELSENKASRGEVEMFELSKQDRIDDLDSIRTKANNAVQPDQISNFVSANDLAKVATTGSYNDLNNKPTIPDAQVNSDWNATSGKAKILNKPSLSKVATTGNYNDLINKPTIPSAVTETTVSGWGFTKNTGTYSKPNGGIPKSDLASAIQTSLGKADTALQTVPEDYATKSWVGGQGFLTEHQDITGKQDNISDLTAIRDGASKGATAVQPSSLAAVATSGNYNDLTNKPTIPAAVTESTVSGWGFTKNTGTYSKPSGGIPKSDLASSVQTSLGKADTALQSYTEQYKGTITGVSANGTSVATSGVANIPAASTSAYGVTKLNSATNSTSTTEAATPSAVKAAYDLANSYKGTVTSVKINDVTKTPTSGVIDLGKVLTEYTPMSVNTVSDTSNLRLYPNRKLTHIGEIVGTATFNLFLSEDNTVDNSWNLSFKTGATAPTINFGFSTTGYTIIWANGVAPTFEANTYYEISFRLLGTYFLGVCGIFKAA